MYTTVLVALITAVIGPSALEIIKNRLKTKDDIDPMFKEMESNILINEKLREAIEKFNIDRIWIAQFHNGGHYYTSGISIKKFSIFYEVVNLGISMIKDRFQNIPTTFFSKAILEVNENDELHISNIIDENEKTYGLKDIMEGTGCKSLFLYALKTPSGKLHGVMGAEKVKEAYPFNEAEKEEIRELGIYIAGMLELIHKFK